MYTKVTVCLLAEPILKRGRPVQSRSLFSHCRLGCSCRSATSQPPLKGTGGSSCGLHEGEKGREERGDREGREVMGGNGRIVVFPCHSSFTHTLSV